uniref:NFIX n=1 Tax=Haemonchus placei TaxID=6290 RepID=A0A0N4VZT5_HAEPC
LMDPYFQKAILNSQSVIICWGAWQPFANRSQLNLNGQVQASVSLIGGPRPNPEESLCFRNLLHLYRRDDSIFTESAPKITIQFNFSLDETRHYGSLSRSTTQLGDSLRDTPAPTRKEVVDVITTDRETERSLRRQEQRQEDSDTAPSEQEETLPPILVKVRDDTVYEILVPQYRKNSSTSYVPLLGSCVHPAGKYD